MTIAVLGLGGAGGNIANEASLLGIHAAAINFSQRDLNSAASVKHKLKVPGSEGVGHDRELAITLMAEHYDMVYQFVQENFGSPSYRLIFVPFATGGGSGAGMAPILLDLLAELMQDKVFVAVPILPCGTEAPVSQANTSATMSELLKLGVCILPVDNDKISGGKNAQYRETNERFSSFLFDLNAFTEKESRNGNFDRTDLATLFSQPGIGVIAEAEIAKVSRGKTDITPEGIAGTIQSSWTSSIFSTIEYDRVTKAALIYDGQESLMNHFDAATIFSPFGRAPIDLFEGYYHEDNGGRILTVLTGLPFPKTRFEQIDARIEAAGSPDTREEEEYKPKTVQTSKPRQRALQAAGVPSAKQGVADILSRYRR
jgi:cell division GTPase FtsZ